MKLILLLFIMLICSCTETPNYKFSEMKGQWVRTNGAYINYKNANGTDSIHYIEYWDFQDKQVKVYEEWYITRKGIPPEYHYTSTHVGEFRGTYECNYDSDASGYQYFMVNYHRVSGSGAPVESFGNYNSYIIESLSDSTAILYWLFESDCSETDDKTYWGQIHLKRYDIDKMATGHWVLH